MPIQPALPAVPHTTLQQRVQWPLGRARAVFTVDAIGHRVPRFDFAGRIHSTFERACNIECGDSLLTLVGPQAGNGPTTLRLAACVQPDLRRWFAVGESVAVRQGVARTERAQIHWAHARIWRPARSRVTSTATQRDARRLRSAALLSRQRRGRSVIDDEALQITAALRDACSELDARKMAQQVARLIGWGEGLTPAGDDFVVGLCAGLDALAGTDRRRGAFRGELTAAIGASVQRTTRISAHHLRLAAAGHYNERLLDMRDALLSDAPWPRVEDALLAACAVGATSGADTIAGLLTALEAWSTSPAAVVV